MFEPFCSMDQMLMRLNTSPLLHVCTTHDAVKSMSCLVISHHVFGLLRCLWYMCVHISVEPLQSSLGSGPRPTFSAVFACLVRTKVVALSGSIHIYSKETHKPSNRTRVHFKLTKHVKYEHTLRVNIF